MQIRGKTNYDKFKDFLLTLKIPSAFIGDIDNINQMAQGNQEIKKLLISNNERISRLVIKNPGSIDNESLVNNLTEAINNGDIEKLKSFWEYIISFRTKIKPDLNEDEKHILLEFIESQQKKNVFILPKGEIEAYLPLGYKKKDLNKILKLTTREIYDSWKEEEGYKELYSIINKIIEDNQIK